MENIADIYELSPMQQGMLFHTLYAPASGVYFEQRSCLLQGNLNLSAFKQAWQEVVARHTVLRTAFYWEEVEKPLQVVYKDIDLLWVEEDWGGIAADEQKARLEAFLAADREQGFNLNQAPLMRCASIRVQENAYQFIWSHHHLLMDGWCNAIILREVLAFYEALSQGKPLFLPPPRPYRDYIAWLQEQDLKQAQAFWQRSLEGFTAPTPLIEDRIQDNSHQAETEREQQIQVSATVTAALHTFAQQHRLTLNTVIQGIWALLLSRYSGEFDIVFGATVSGRPPALAGVESIMGLFINTLPVRVKIAPEDELIPWLQQLQAQQIEREQYAYTSLIDIQGWSEVPRGTPLFESLVVFENYPTSLENALQAWHGSLTILNGRGFEKTNYPMTLFAIPGKELSLRISYDGNRFDATTIEQILGHLETLLVAIASNPHRTLQALPFLTQTEQQQLLIAWNQTQADYPLDKCIHQLFESQVEQTPDAIAAVFEEEQITYRALARRANQLARALRKLGVGPEVLVGICVERSLEMVVGLLGILKAGGAYVPLDPTYPKERLAFMLEDANVSVLLTQEKLIADFPQLNAHIICLDNGRAIAQEPDRNLPHLVNPDNLAYVIYTSGSTGQPKGVQILHKALVNFLTAMSQAPGLTQNDILLSVTTLSFDIAGLELYLPLIVGARSVIVGREVAADGSQLLESLKAFGVTVMQATPATWRLLLAAGWQGSPFLKILCGGEALDVQLAEQLLERGQEVWNLYGPTETTIWSSVYRVEDKGISACVPIGRPIANTQFYVLDAQLNPVPIGIAGELYIGGAGLARGYLNRPDLTAEKLIPNPFRRRKQANHLQPSTFNLQLYKTGDSVRYRSDGSLEYLGRLDNQVKIRGFRIELGEIEAALKQHPEVREAVAVVQEDEAGDKRLVAYIVPNLSSSSSHTPPSHLRHFLQEKLLDYMVPSVFVPMESFPLTPNGKVDRKALPTPNRAEFHSEKLYIAPRTPTEEMLAGIWANVLNVEQVGVEDNFFELGGHSLLATRVISQIREVFAIELPLRRLFETPTLAALSQAIEIAKLSETSLEIPPIEPIPREGELPLSFAQQRQWFLAQLEPNNPFYNIPVAIRLNGAFQIALLEQSFNEVLRRHEVLRTAFRTIEGHPIQVISPTAKLDLPVIDLSELLASEQEMEVQQIALEEAQQAFYLNMSPLLRVKSLRLSETEQVVLLTMHHIISDGWSMGVLVRELATLYQAFSTQQPSPLEELPIQYVDFANWQRQWLLEGRRQEAEGRRQESNLESQLAYWQEQLKDTSTILELPTDRSRPALPTFRGASYRFKLSRQLSKALKILSRQLGSTLFMTLLAVFYALLHRYTGSEDIIVGSPIANRDRAEIEDLIGFFVNTLALRTDLSSNPTFEELLQRVRQVALDAYAHQNLPFERILEALQIQRTLSHTPLFQVMFVLQNAPMQSIEVSGLSWSPIEIESGTAKFDLTLSLTESDKGLVGAFEYNRDLFEESTIEQMAGCFHTLLTAIIENPEQRLSELPLLSESERQQLLVEWNDTQTDYPREACIHELFEAQVAKTPDAIAVVIEEQQLTYWELNTRANQLAHYLQLGVKTETLVGLCCDRSLEMIIGLLGILKAGGAYVPLDPTYPQERLEFMLEDTKLEVLLIQFKIPNHRAELALSSTKFKMKNTVNLDRNWEIITQESRDNLTISITPENLAYVMYTSGSTGVPKGVCIPHRGVVRLVKESNYAKLGTDEVFLQAAPTAFDASTFEIWGALLNGGKLVLLPECQPSLVELRGAIAHHNITTLWLTAGLFHLMVDEQLESLANIRQLLAGGDVLSGAHIQKFLRRHKNSRLINGYGPTESTTFTCTHFITETNQVGSSPPIGRPISNTQVYILDRHLQPVPIGVPGELYIRGDGLARGYLNRPELTAEKFIPNPFHNSERLYKTGDLVRYQPDGNIEYLGRLDNQVKIRGFRVELGEIEAVLTQHPQVKEAVVTAQEDAQGNKRLVAYIVPNLSSPSSHTPHTPPSHLRHFLQEKLPEYLIPSLFVPLDALPLTANGKVDRQALPTPEITREDLDEAFVSPRTSIETQLAKIWAEILNLEQVGIHDNFFELGGDSILAIQIISKANQAGLQLTPKQLFQHQTIAELATIVVAPEAIQSEQGLVTGSVPLTPIQHWFFEQNLPNPHHFNQAVLLEIELRLDLSLLKQALQALLLHHDALRLRFERQASGWQQVNASFDDEIPLIDIDLSLLPETEQKVALEAGANELQTSLNLTQGLLQIAFFDLGRHQSSRLLFIIHHLAIDGISWRILLEDLQKAYEQLNSGELVQLLPKTTSFKQWSERLQKYAHSEVLQAERNYWQTLSSQPISSLPVDYPAEANTVASTDTVSISLSVEQTQALLQEVPQAYNTQINDVLLTALVQAFRQWMGNSSVLIDLESHGREPIADEINLSRTVGWFTNIFPVHLDLGEANTPGKALTTIKEQLRSLSHQGIGYGILRYLVPLEQAIAPSKAEVSFNYLGQFDRLLSSSMFALAQESTGLPRDRQGKRPYLLEINGLVREGQLRLDWTYSRAIHRLSTIENLAQNFLTALQQLIEHCQSSEAGGYTPSDFSLAQLEQEQLDAVLALVEFEGE